MIFETLGGILIVVGAGFVLISALGVLRMPDFFTRLHPAGVADSFGAPLLLLGVGFVLGEGLLMVKFILLAVFLMLTSATACHALAKSALVKGLKPTHKKGK